MKTGNGLFWFRRDLRLRDNPGLAKAAAEHRHVLPVFIHDPEIKVSKRRQNAVLAVIAGLSTEMNHQLKQERGDPKEILLRLVAEHQISKVYVTAEFTPFGISRDKEISQALAAVGVDWVPIDSPYLVSPGVLKTGAGQPYRVFTPFYRSWLNAPKPQLTATVTADWLVPVGNADRSNYLDSKLAQPLTYGDGELAWQNFLDNHLADYATGRDALSPHTSKLSARLRFGGVHPRELIADLARVDPDQQNSVEFIRQLCWRDFAADVYFYHPKIRTQALIPKFQNFPYDHPEMGGQAAANWAAWCNAETGYPIVDAAIKQLVETGWISGRLRMVVASFLVKHLNLDWRLGEQFFAEHLLDFDPASNAFNWQWVAGCGFDAAPYFRVFNPTLQSRKFDPTASYLTSWLPQLVTQIDPHQPTEFSDYPAPIVEHALARQLALARYHDWTRLNEG